MNSQWNIVPGNINISVLISHCEVHLMLFASNAVQRDVWLIPGSVYIWRALKSFNSFPIVEHGFHFYFVLAIRCSVTGKHELRLNVILIMFNS